VRWLVVVLGVLGAVKAQQAAAVDVVHAPAAAVARLAPWWREHVGPVAELRGVDDWARADVANGAVWLADEWTLAALSARSMLRPWSRTPGAPAVPFVLPWRTDHVLVATAAAAVEWTPAAGTCTWEDLALHPALHDRLRIVGPEVDGGPWLAMMRHRLARGEPEANGYALWTTIDARAGALQTTHGDPPAAAAPAAKLFWLLPRHLAEPWPGGEQWPVQDSAVRLGCGLGSRASPGLVDVLVRLTGPELVRSVAGRLGLPTGPSSGADAPPLDPTAAAAWTARFEATVRGRGRTVERLADVLDLLFGAAFALVAATWWWRQHRGHRRARAAEKPAPKTG
jgi:hypothetical protein